MNLNPQELHPSYRDWWSEFDPNTIALMDAINRSGCYVPRVFVAPSGGNLVQNTVAGNGYTNFVLEVPAGSFIFGIYSSGIGGFTMQITDLGLSYKWFNTPIAAGVFASDPEAPYLFPCLYPVMEPGTLFCEFYNQLATPNNLEVTFGAAVPIEKA